MVGPRGGRCRDGGGQGSRGLGVVGVKGLGGLMVVGVKFVLGSRGRGLGVVGSRE